MTVLFLLSKSGIAQIDHPVKWQYGVRRLSADQMELHLKAVINTGWYTYSQFTPEGGPLPTKIVFTDAGAYETIGHIRESGKMQTKYEEAFGVNVSFFKDSVDFIQTIRLKQGKMPVRGTIEFMACNGRKCLAPETVNFTIAVN